MEHSSSGLSSQRSLDTPHHGQISDPERPNKHPCLAQSSQSDQRQSPQAVRQLEASTSQPRECEDDREGREKSTGYSSQQVFLSHSGQQKNFVEQLFVDLKRERIASFFDKDPDSLPKGEEFPPLIFQAARRCRVAVVVLSEHFITSKWPMIELCAFLDAKKISNPSLKIFPLFFEMSPAELSERIANKDVYTSWVNSKNPQTICDSSIDWNAWFKALKGLKPINGEVYNQVEGEVVYRGKIVDGIRRLLPPNWVYKNPFVKGKQRLCQVVEKLFDDTPYRENRVKIAGLYGVSGSGKTTLCKSVCDFFSHEFKDKVFHVELQGKACIETFKRALKVLAGASKTVVKNSVRSIEDGSGLLEEMMSGKKVFLAIDNISDADESIEEAQLYLNAVCSGYESRILLTARSLGVLRKLIPNPESSCMHVPDLEEEEAIGVLLRLTPVKVSGLTRQDKDVARLCIQKCRFTWYSGNGKEYRAYHPSVLKRYGAYLYDKFKSCDLSLWTDIPNLSKSQIGPLEEIFCVFEKILKGLSSEFFRVFMLVCLYLPEPRMHCSRILNWLALICDRCIQDIDQIITQLKNKGFMEGERGYYIHELLMDFAESHADGTGKWVSFKNAVEIPTRLQQASSNERVRFEAMKLHNCEFQSLTGVHYDLLSDVSVLHLQNMAILETLDLSSVQMVRSLALVGCPKLEEIKGVEGMMPLGHLEGNSEHFNEWPIRRSPEWPRPLLIGNLPIRDSRLRNLRTVYLSCECRVTGTLDFRGCPNLETIDLRKCGMTGLALDECTRLTFLTLEMPNLEELPLLGGLTHLKELFLCKMEKLKRLPELSQLSNLETLRLEGMPNLEEFPIPSFQCLTNLTYIYLGQMPNFKELPSFTGLSKLKFLHLVEMPHLEKFPCLGGLSDLRALVLRKMEKLRVLPSFGELTELRVLSLKELPNLREVPFLNGLTKLCEIKLEGMPNLKEHPCLDGLTNLGRSPALYYYPPSSFVDEFPPLVM